MVTLSIILKGWRYSMEIMDSIKSELIERGITKTNEQIEVELNKIDTNILTEQEYTKYAVEIWDKTSPINGIPASTILQHRDDIPENGSVYLITKGVK